jgi:hypothetical protein
VTARLEMASESEPASATVPFVESGEGTGDRGAGRGMCWMTIVSVRTGNTVHARPHLRSVKT